MSKKLFIGFFGHGVPFHGDSLEGSLGGSETAVIYMARELSKRGHDVKVFSKCPKPGRYDGVDYFDYETSWRDLAPIADWDVFIVSRFFPFLAQKFNSKLTGLWNHDILTNESALMQNIWQCDFMWCLSQFHKEQYLSKAPHLAPVLSTTRNGVDLPLINRVLSETPEKDFDSFVYGSRPERGLDVLLEKVWPRILQEVNSKAVLRLAGYDVAPEMISEDMKAYYKHIDALIDSTPNVERLGSLKQEDWIRVIARSGFMLYPTSFPEISCINSLLAQACKTPIITTDGFALSESVRVKENLIRGNPKTEEYVSAFVARVKCLYDPGNSFNYKLAQKQGYQHVENSYSWSEIAEEWEHFFWNHFKSRSQRYGGKDTLKTLVYESDLVTAKWCLDHSSEVSLDIKQCCKVQTEVEGYLVNHDVDPETYNEGEKANPEEYKKVSRFKTSLGVIKKEFEDKPFRLLDVGCGIGGFLDLVLSELPNAEVVGLDFSQNLVNRATAFIAENHPESRFSILCADALDESYKLQDCFDVVFAGEWLEHQIDYQGALAKLELLTGVGGLVVITIPSGPWEALSYRNSGSVRHHVHHFRFRDIEEIFGCKDFKMEFLPAAVSHIDGSLLGNWVIYWKADGKPFGQVNFKRKFWTTRPYQSVSACLIVKNEEDNLAKALKSIRPMVDEIVVCDTGSSDSTLEIAHKYADKVQVIPWSEDFSEARNLSASLTDPDARWIYWMDADEELVNANRLRKYLHNDLYPGYVIRQNHLVLDMANVKPDVPVRLYRTDKGIKFYGCIHEHCAFGLNDEIDPSLILPDVHIVHYGYITEGVRRDKCRRNLPLLKLDREKYPERRLGIVLMMRDYLNLSQWELEETGGHFNENILKRLREVVRLHRSYFREESDIHHELSFALYQRALDSLGSRGFVAIGDQIPFQVALGLGGAVGGLQNPDGVKCNSFWFADKKEFSDFVTTRLEMVSSALQLV